MQKNIIVHIGKFKRHERRYMLGRLRAVRPWLFYHVTFNRPPFKSSPPEMEIKNFFALVKPNQKDISSYKPVIS